MTFTLDCMMTKPSQRLVVVAACDRLAGTALRAEARPEAKYTAKLKPSSSEADENATPDTKPQPKKLTPMPKGPAKPVQASRPRTKACLHTCKDKATCKHACCKTGVNQQKRSPSSNTSANKQKQKAKHSGFISDSSSDDEFSDAALDEAMAALDEDALLGRSARTVVNAPAKRKPAAAELEAKEPLTKQRSQIKQSAMGSHGASGRPTNMKKPKRKITDFLAPMSTTEKYIKSLASEPALPTSTSSSRSDHAGSTSDDHLDDSPMSGDPIEPFAAEQATSTTTVATSVIEDVDLTFPNDEEERDKPAPDLEDEIHMTWSRPPSSDGAAKASSGPGMRTCEPLQKHRSARRDEGSAGTSVDSPRADAASPVPQPFATPVQQSDACHASSDKSVDLLADFDDWLENNQGAIR